MKPYPCVAKAIFTYSIMKTDEHDFECKTNKMGQMVLTQCYLDLDPVLANQSAKPERGFELIKKKINTVYKAS